MAFFKKYNGTTNARLLRMERLIWTLVYGGLLSLVLGYFMENSQGADPTALYAIGTLATAIGILMIFIRSRLREEP
jgi:vacuolar-type H+-ATPase subunit I/STV1